jgi:hypothetical protein
VGGRFSCSRIFGFGRETDGSSLSCPGRHQAIADSIALAVELRALIGHLQRFAFLVFPLVGDRTGLRVPFPRASNFDSARPSIERLHVPRKFCVPGVADSLDLPKGIEAVGLGHLFGNRWELLRLEVAARTSADTVKAKRRITLGRLEFAIKVLLPGLKLNGSSGPLAKVAA